MNHLSPGECIEISKLINPKLTWVWNDHFDKDDPPFYAINGIGISNELYILKIYYSNDMIVLIDGNSENMDENIIDFKSNNKILQIINKMKKQHISKELIAAYSDYLKDDPNLEKRKFKFEFAQKAISNGKTLNQLGNLGETTFYLPLFIDSYISDEISEDELKITNGEFNLGVDIKFVRHYFKETKETSSVSKNGTIIELKAYGDSLEQNRKIIAFIGTFENNKLAKFEDKTSGVKSLSFQNFDFKTSKNYYFNKETFYEFIIMNNVSGILNKTQATFLYNYYVNRYQNYLEFIKKEVLSGETEWYFRIDKEIGMFVDAGNLYNSDTHIEVITNDVKKANFVESNFTPRDFWYQYFINKYVEIGSDLSSFNDLKARTVTNSQGQEFEVFLINKVINFIIGKYNEEMYSSEQTKKLNPELFSITDYKQETALNNYAQELIKLADDCAKDAVIQDKKAEKAEKAKKAKEEEEDKKNTRIGCLIIIITILILLVYIYFLL